MKSKILIAGLLLTVSQTAYGFGHKKMNLTEVRGVTETQLVKSSDTQKLSVMVRGRAAELLFRTMEEKRTEQLNSDALELIGDIKNTHWTVKGKQMACSRIQSNGKKKADYACAFWMNPKGEVAGDVEPFSPSVFNLAKTKTHAKIFPKKKSGRSLASVQPAGPFPAAAYVMYDPPKKDKKPAKPEYEDALIVFKGSAATEIMGFLTESKSFKEFILAGTKGLKGKEISCVEATGKELARCALVVSLDSGSVSTRKNPLFR